MIYKFRKFLKDETVQEKYLQAGSDFGNTLSYSVYFWDYATFGIMLENWAKWEEEYAKRGFKTISLGKFIGAGGYGRDISDLIGKKCRENETPVFYAELYRENYFNRFEPLLDIAKMIKKGKLQSAEFLLPEREHAGKAATN